MSASISHDDMVIACMRNLLHDQPISAASELYESCDDVRGGRNPRQKAEQIVSAITANMQFRPSDEGNGKFIHLLFTGHKGTGKSTELKTVKERLTAEKFRVIYFRAEDQLNLTVIEPPDIFLAVFRETERQLRETDTHGVKIPDNLSKQILHWFGDVVYNTADEKELTAHIEAGLVVEPSIPLLGKLFTRLTNEVKSKTRSQVTFTQKLKTRLADLINLMNFVFNHVNTQLKKMPEFENGLVVIIDNLEKIVVEFTDAEKGRSNIDFFSEYGSSFTDLNCHIIYTIPISAIYSPMSSRFKQLYSKVIVLPMVKITATRSNRPFAPGIEKLGKIATKRLPYQKELFASPALIAELAKLSGGNIKVFIRLLNDALMQIYNRDEQVTQQTIDILTSEEVTTFHRSIYDHYFPNLVAVYDTKQIAKEPDRKDLDALNNEWILEYENDKPWYDINPAIVRLEKFQDELKKYKAAQA